MRDKKIVMKDVGKVFDTYITLQNKVKADGPFQSLDEYEDYVSLWAESRFLRGRNFYSARAANVKTDVEFIVRYRADLCETMRIKVAKDGVADENRYYNIEGILPLDNNRLYLTIKANEIKHDL